jgi:ketosteroid isomerase-like protein
MLKTSAEDVAAIRARIMVKRDAYLRRDADGALDTWLRNEDICVFDLASSLQYHGFDALHATTHGMVDGSEGPFEIDFGEPTVMASGDLACSWQILHVIAHQKSGQTTDIRVRQTDVWNRVDGCWYIVHEHNSLPLAPGVSERMLNISEETTGRPGSA